VVGLRHPQHSRELDAIPKAEIAMAEREGYGIYILGARSEMLETAVQQLHEVHPDEWPYRLLQEPRRMFRRYLVTNTQATTTRACPRSRTSTAARPPGGYVSSAGLLGTAGSTIRSRPPSAHIRHVSGCEGQRAARLTVRHRSSTYPAR
jgi:hypothetical protein